MDDLRLWAKLLTGWAIVALAVLAVAYAVYLVNLPGTAL